MSDDVLLTPEQIAAEERRWLFDAPIAELAEVKGVSIDEAVKMRTDAILREAQPMKLDVSVRVIEPVKNLMGFANVKFNDCFVVENLKIVQGTKGLFVGMPSQPDGKGGYREMAKPVTKEFREQLNAAVLEAYEAKLEQMVERGSAGRTSISDQLKAGKKAAEQAKAEKAPKEKPSRGQDR